VVDSSFTNNSGINGSAISASAPAGILQLHDSTFEGNFPRPGKCDGRLLYAFGLQHLRTHVGIYSR
jgi:hypothetical protein